MLEAKKLPPPSRLQPPSAPAPNPLPYHHHYYGTFPPPSQPPPVGGAAYPASQIGRYSLPPARTPSALALLVSRNDDSMVPCLGRRTGFASLGVVAFPGTVQQQIFVEGVPVQEPPLPSAASALAGFCK